MNLSDGGHFENLGLYELVRRRCRFIIVCDARGGRRHLRSVRSAAPSASAARTSASRSTSIPIRSVSQADGFSTAHCVVGTHCLPRSRDRVHGGDDQRHFAGGGTGHGRRQWPARGWLLYLKASLTGDEPADVIEYRSRAPRVSTPEHRRPVLLGITVRELPPPGISRAPIGVRRHDSLGGPGGRGMPCPRIR